MGWSKYGAKKVTQDGMTFASKAENKRYCELKLRQAAGEIEALECQPKFPIAINGQKICTVILDFKYLDKATGRWVHEDVKGFDPPISKLKRKLLRAVFPDVELLILTAR